MPGKMKNGALGVKKKKVTRRRQPRGLRSYVKAVAKYLVSDAYMYAPLVNHAPADKCSVASSPSADGNIQSPLNTEAIRKLSSKVSAKRILYEEFVEKSGL